MDKPKKKKYRKSKSSVQIGVRLSLADAEILDRRVEAYPGEMHRGTYIAMRMHYDLNREHIKHEGQSDE